MKRATFKKTYPGGLERMEPRVLLAADIVLDGGVLTLTGTEGNDTMSVVRVGFDDVRATVNSLTRTFDMDDINSYGMFGLGGADQMTKTGRVNRAEGLGFSMDGGPGNDILRGTEIIVRQGEEIRDESGRTVASKVTGTNDQLIYGTSAADVIALSEGNGVAAAVSINLSFLGEFDPTEYAHWTVFGRAGNDAISIGGLFSPEVKIFGEDGNDVFTVPMAAKVYIEAGDGDDLLRAGGDDFSAVRLFSGGAGVDTVDMLAQQRLDLTSVTDIQVFPDVENVTNAQGTVIGNDLNNRITVRASDTEGVEVHAGGGDDTVVGGPGPDRFFGEAGHDTLIGNGANDLLDGGFGIDDLNGGPGDDTLLNGENGAGPRVFIDAARWVYAFGTLGADTFSVVRIGFDDVRVTVNSVSRVFDMDDFDLIQLEGGPGNDRMTLGNGIQTVLMHGGAGDDNISGNDRYNEILGDAGNDILNGGGGDDLITGGEGNDTIDGGSGSDLVHGNGGNDTITGGPDFDDLYGDDGNDTILARDGEGDLNVDGGSGFDRARVDITDPRDNIEQFLA
jgi:Ca2+-binding RTX toxin-like protein